MLAIFLYTVHFTFNIYTHSQNCLQMKNLRFRKTTSIPRSHKLSSETCTTKNRASWDLAI